MPTVHTRITEQPWVTGLCPAGTPGVDPALPEPTLDRVLALLGPEPVEWAVQRAHEFAVHVLREIPELDGTGGRARMVRMGAESALIQILALLVDRRTTIVMPDEQEQVVRDCVHRRVPVDRLWAAVRTTHAWATRILMDACIELVPPARQVAELRRVSAVALTVFDRLTERADQEYRAETERWFSGEHAEREELVGILLHDEKADPDRVCLRLGYPITGRQHLGVVAWQRGADSGSDVAAAAAAWLRAAGATDVLVLPRTPTVVWAWGAAAAVPLPGPLPAAPDGIRIGHGDWHRDLAGFRMGHREARAVERVAVLCPRLDDPVLAFGTIDLLAVLLENPERAAEFAARELGSLAGPDPRSRELRDTIRLYLESNSPKAVADRMYLARSTVAYRLRQAEQALNRNLTDRRFQLWAALVLADAIEPMVAEHARS